jgi:hypothetical protein
LGNNVCQTTPLARDAAWHCRLHFASVSDAALGEKRFALGRVNALDGLSPRLSLRRLDRGIASFSFTPTESVLCKIFESIFFAAFLFPT